jgi:copper chaperone CopZ
MRRFPRAAAIMVLVSVLIVGACGREEVVARTEFSVEGMTCDSCSNGIIATLEKVDGVVSVSADHEKGFAEAVYQQTKVNDEELEAEIEKLGFTVVGLKTEVVDG